MTDSMTHDEIKALLAELALHETWIIQEADAPHKREWLEIVSPYGTVIAKVYNRDNANLIVATPTIVRQLLAEVEALETKVDVALIRARYGSEDGAHYKMWAIDQMVRALTGANYETWVKDFRAGEDGPDTYSWDTGIAP